MSMDPITSALEAIRLECIAAAAFGVLADYIPQLSQADPEWFGLVLESLTRSSPPSAAPVIATARSRT